jgi:hypothetical protein
MIRLARWPPLVPLASLAVVVASLLWERQFLNAVPGLSSAAGFAAVLLAPGLTLEPHLHGRGWTPLERLAFASVCSVASVALFGLALHLLGFPISPANVLLGLLAITAIGSLAAFPRRRGSFIAITATPSMRLDVAIAAASLLMLGAGFAAVLVLRPGPAAPGLEAALLDAEGRLATLPFEAADETFEVIVAIRSLNGEAADARVAVSGEHIASPTQHASLQRGHWTNVEMPIRFGGPGLHRAIVRVSASTGELTLPIAVKVP